MNKRRALAFSATLISGLLVVGVVLAQVSTNYDLSWHLLSGGGGERQSANYLVHDALAQLAIGPSASTNYLVESGFLHEAVLGVSADEWEDDDSCAAASTITTDGSPQTHNFHDEGDLDWVKFTATSGKTYIIQTQNVGDNVDTVLLFYDVCEAPPLASEDDAFGRTVRLEWDCTSSGTYYVRLQQHNPSVYGEGTNYDLSVSVDSTAPSYPKNFSATPGDEMLILQWTKSPESDVVGYRVYFGTESGVYSGLRDVAGGATTYYELTGPQILNGMRYYLVLTALDFTGNESTESGEISAVPTPPTDDTLPVVSINIPTSGEVYTTTLSSLTIGGGCTDSGENLSRVHVVNSTNGSEGWDYSLSGASDSFSVGNINLNSGGNTIQVTAHDSAGNTGSDSLTINRVGAGPGAVVIVAGHNDSNSLQTNIDYCTNRAYETFLGAGFTAGDIYYLNPGPQDANGDGFNDVDATSNPANSQYAIETWAAAKVGPGKPFFLYLMDHGGAEKFCADGCGSDGAITPEDLNDWLDGLESASGCDSVNVIVEACHSGSFIDRVPDVLESISKPGRVVIASTGKMNNAYASAQGAYFSDAFFSAVAESSDILTCFNAGKAAVAATGINQTPWLDDNGNAQSDIYDGTYAGTRYIASFFGAGMPDIVAVSVSVVDGTGTISATVERGDEETEIVWAGIYPPSFKEPDYTTLELGVPLLRLLEQEETGGTYVESYSAFVETGQYRVVVYAQDEAGNQASPEVVMVGLGVAEVYLPLVVKSW